jgi:hypothetical protein
MAFRALNTSALRAARYSAFPKTTTLAVAVSGTDARP